MRKGDSMECPICRKDVASFHKANTNKPFTSYDPIEGLTVWGPYSAPKIVLCENKRFVHFQFADTEERLVELIGED